MEEGYSWSYPIHTYHNSRKPLSITGCTPLTYLRDYQEGGIEKLKEINFYRPKSAARMSMRFARPLF